MGDRAECVPPSRRHVREYIRVFILPKMRHTLHSPSMYLCIMLVSVEGLFVKPSTDLPQVRQNRCLRNRLKNLAYRGSD